MRSEELGEHLQKTLYQLVYHFKGIVLCKNMPQTTFLKVVSNQSKRSSKYIKKVQNVIRTQQTDRNLCLTFKLPQIKTPNFAHHNFSRLFVMGYYLHGMAQQGLE